MLLTLSAMPVAHAIDGHSGSEAPCYKLPDATAAVAACTVAAAQGHAGAAYRLARIYNTGMGAQRDWVEAWTRFELAVRGVQANAAYVRAKEVPLQRDRPDERSWRQSEISNLSNIAEIRDNLGKQMSRKQLEDAKLRADAWRVSAS